MMCDLDSIVSCHQMVSQCCFISICFIHHVLLFCQKPQNGRTDQHKIFREVGNNLTETHNMLWTAYVHMVLSLPWTVWWFLFKTADKMWITFALDNWNNLPANTGGQRMQFTHNELLIDNQNYWQIICQQGMDKVYVYNYHWLQWVKNLCSLHPVICPIIKIIKTRYL